MPAQIGNKLAFKDGTTILNGYRFIYRPNHLHANSNGYVREHRLVYEESRSCCLLQWVDVHHIDENKLNNIWYNLKPISKSKHRRHHQLIYSLNHKCIICGNNETFIKKNGTRFWVHGMCRKCNNKKYFKEYYSRVVLSAQSS